MKYLPFLSLLLLGLPLVVFGQVDPGFVPLTTNAPFLDNVGNADSLSAFLNDIYKVCIGIAATLAVLQIMRAGIMYMGGDSVTEKKEAKNLIAMSIGGLILVLSPVVVFSIINPEILNLEIKGLSELASDVEDWDGVVSEEVRDATVFISNSMTRAEAATSCQTQNGTLIIRCTKKDGSGSRTVPQSEQCDSVTENEYKVCQRGATTPEASCSSFSHYIEGTGGLCNADSNYVSAPLSCCQSLNSSRSACCGSTSGKKFDDPGRTNYFSSFRSTEAKAQEYENACNSLQVPAVVQDVVERRNGTKVRGESDPGTGGFMYTAHCESYSKVFRQYKLDATTLKNSPGIDKFRDGCRSDRGQLQRKHNGGIWRPYETESLDGFEANSCSSQEIENIRRAYGNPSLEPLCRNREFRCIKN